MTLGHKLLSGLPLSRPRWRLPFFYCVYGGCKTNNAIPLCAWVSVRCATHGKEFYYCARLRPLKATIYLGNATPTSGTRWGRDGRSGPRSLGDREPPRSYNAVGRHPHWFESTICEVAACARIRRTNIQLPPKVRQIE